MSELRIEVKGDRWPTLAEVKARYVEMVYSKERGNHCRTAQVLGVKESPVLYLSAITRIKLPNAPPNKNVSMYRRYSIYLEIITQKRLSAFLIIKQ